MTTKVQAIYENGVFRPATPVPVAEGATVELTVSTSASLADALAHIAKLPVTSPNDGFSGTDHDRVIYGKSTPK